MPIIRLRPVNRCACLRVNMIETTHTQYNIYHPFFCYDRQRTTYRYSQRRPFRRVDSLLPAVGLCPDDPRTAPCRDPGVADQPHSRRAAPCPDSCRTHHRAWRSACPHARRMASACPLCLPRPTTRRNCCGRWLSASRVWLSATRSCPRTPAAATLSHRALLMPCLPTTPTTSVACSPCSTASSPPPDNRHHLLSATIYGSGDIRRHGYHRFCFLFCMFSSGNQILVRRRR